MEEGKLWSRDEMKTEGFALRGEFLGPFPGGPVCRPYEMRESSSLAVGADDLGGPRAHTMRSYGSNGLP